MNRDDHLCGCCETSCATRKARSLDIEGIDPFCAIHPVCFDKACFKIVTLFRSLCVSTLEDEATVGPISVMLTPASENGHLLQIQESPRPSSKDAGDLIYFTFMMAFVFI